MLRRDGQTADTFAHGVEAFHHAFHILVNSDAEAFNVEMMV